MQESSQRPTREGRAHRGRPTYVGVALTAALLVAPLAAAPKRCAAQNYTLTVLYDTATSPYRSFGDVLINDSGLVAFRAELDAGGGGLFTGAGDASPAQSVFSTSTTSALGEIFSLNSAGQVAFRFSDGAQEQVYVGAAGATPTLVASTGAAFQGFGLPSLNDSGTVSFIASAPGGARALYTAAAGGAPVAV